MSEGVPEGASLPEGIDVDDTAAYFGVTKSSDVLQQLMAVSYTHLTLPTILLV